MISKLIQPWSEQIDPEWAECAFFGWAELPKHVEAGLMLQAWLY